MKILKKLRLFILLFFAILFYNTTVARADTTNVTLHNSWNNLVLQNAQIDIYDVTQKAKTSQSAEVIEQSVKNTPPLASISTNQYGEAQISLENVINQERVCYLFTQVNQQGTQLVMQPILLSLPVYDENEQLISQVDLFPKHYPPLHAPYFYKHGKDLVRNQDLGVLTGAVFVLSKNEGTNELYLQKTSDGSLKWTVNFSAVETITDFSKLVGTQANFNPNLAFFTSDSKGKVTTGDYLLPAGTYQFKEIQAPQNYAINRAAHGDVKVEIQPTSLDIKITLLNNGKLITTSPDLAVYYNELEEIPTTYIPPPSNKLPFTGTITSLSISIGGLILVGIMITLKNKRRVK